MATKSKSGTPNTDKIAKRNAAKKHIEDDDLVFAFLTKEILDELDKCNNDTNAELAIFADAFGLTGWVGDIQQSVQLSIYHNVYVFAKENHFSQHQTSIFFSLIKNAFDKFVESSFRSMSAVEDFKTALLKQLRSDSSTNSTSPELLTLDICTLITSYASTSLFQHINLYKYVFTQEQEEAQLNISKTLELPPLSFQPLNDSRTAESVAEEEEYERMRLENLDTFNSEIDIFESLSPEEIKTVTAETVAALIESIQIETEKTLQEQRQKILAQNSKP